MLQVLFSLFFIFHHSLWSTETFPLYFKQCVILSVLSHLWYAFVCELIFAKYDSGDEKEDDTEVDKEHEVGGEPLQQMPGSQMKSDMISGKSIPYLENGEEDVSLTKSEVRYEPDQKLHDAANSGDENDVKMEEAKGEENGSDKKHGVHGLPHEEVPQPDLDAVK